MHAVEPSLASRALWLDALVGNVDRSWRNPNLLLWHRELQLIDHGACLVFHHDWARAGSAAEKPYDTADQVLGSFATERGAAGDELAAQVDRSLLSSVVALVPDEWLADEPGFDSAGAVREAYVDHLLRRVAAREVWQP